MAAEIVVVDDSPTILTLLVLALSKEGFDAVTATNGAEALERIGRASCRERVSYHV